MIILQQYCNYYLLTACKEIEVLVMAKVSDAVSTRYNVRGNSPGHSGTALTKKGASANPRKSIKVDIIIN